MIMKMDWPPILCFSLLPEENALRLNNYPVVCYYYQQEVHAIRLTPGAGCEQPASRHPLPVTLIVQNSKIIYINPPLVIRTNKCEPLG